MKKIFLVAGVALLAACNGTTSSENNVQGNSMTDTAMTTNNAAAGTGTDTGMTTQSNGTGVAGTGTTTTTTTTSTSSSQAYAPSEGDVTRRNGKVMVYRNNTWVSADRDMTGDDGVTISRSGSVTRNGKTVEIQEGETVTKSGNFFDKVGNAAGKVWDKTKEVGKDVGHGAKEVGKDVGNAAKKVGGKVKDAVDKDDK
ncbi:MAG: hypothetical protein EOO12_05865 [Chitinophagaceae bacterium]|nr:MAG: hypothetical protein EOO12_05865 [Chitinophagaceae bacterium]